MGIIIAFILGTFAGIFVLGLARAADEPNMALVYKAYRLLVDARDTGNYEEVVNVAEEVIGYLGQALE